MTFTERYGPWALVTGASSGIGEAFARLLAARGISLILVARRRDRLERLAQELAARHGVEAVAVELDLERDDFMPALEQALAGRDVGLVLCNAGFGHKGAFLDAPLDEYLRMLAVNCRATLVLTHHLGRRLRARGRGGIVVTSSTAAFQGLPFSAHYAATKGYGLQLAEGLAHELAPHGVDVVALCPGATDTEGPKRTGVDPSRVPVAMMSPETVARAALGALGKRTVVVPGAVNLLAATLVRFVPRAWASAAAGRLMARVRGAG